MTVTCYVDETEVSCNTWEEPLNMRDELLGLLKDLAYKKGEFTLSSGKTSEHYVNCKPVTLTGRGLTLASIMLLEHVEQDSVAVAGLTLGADPLAVSYTHLTLPTICSV